jgi:hypothetical protein
MITDKQHTIMKKLYLIFSMALMLFLGASLISCDEDDYRYSDNELREMAATISGRWSGTTDVFTVADGNMSYKTVVSFTLTTYYGGNGIQNDYNPDGTIAWARTFEWAVNRHGDINIVYDNSDGSRYAMTIDYDDLYLNANTFQGVLYGRDGQEKDVFSWYTRAAQSAPGKIKLSLSKEN